MNEHAAPQCHRPLRTVLIGSSLGEESDQVVRAGLAVARAAGARVVLVHAVSDPQIGTPDSDLWDNFTQEAVAAAREALAGQAARLGIGEAELAGTEAAAGAAHRVLVETAGTAGADLIVVGATGSGPLAAELLGSTADRVLRKATCPVLLVRGELPVPPRRVLAPVDLSPLSGDAFRCGLDLLGQLAKGEEIEVRAVHAQSFLDTLAIQRQQPGISSEEVERHGAAELRRFVLESRAEAPFKVQTAILPGEARFEILADLEKHPADLVVLGTQGRSGLDRLMLGSVASTVARKAPCSVLLISPQAARA